MKSVYENMSKIQNSKLNQDKLISSIQEWHSTATENLVKTEAKVDGAIDQLRKCSDRLLVLQDCERKYYKLVRDFHAAVSSK